MKLIVAEKKSVATDIAKALGDYKTLNTPNGYIEGKNHIYAFASGHLLEEVKPNEIDENYKWNINCLPIKLSGTKEIPLKVKEKGTNPKFPPKKTYNVIKKLLKDSSFDEIICATDADKEGESIFRNIYKYSGCKKPFTRMWIKASSKKGLLDAYNDRKPSKEYDNYAKAAKARSVSDYIVGMSSTMALTSKYSHFPNIINCGRVQTAALDIVVKREEEIKSFVPEEYYTITLSLNKDNIEFKGLVFSKEDNKTQLTKINNDKFLSLLDKTKPIKVISVDKSLKKISSPKFFTLSGLQQEMGRVCGMSPDETLNHAQSLYNTHKLTTYPRTSAETIDITHNPNDVNDCLTSLKPYFKEVSEINSNGWSINTNVLSKGSGAASHEAITPLLENRLATSPNSLSPREKLVYDVIVKRFLASFYPDYKYNSTIVILEQNGVFAKAVGKETVDLGWKAIYNTSSSNDDNLLPILNEEDLVNINEIESLQKFTTPPNRYSKTEFIGIMENIHRFFDDKKDKDLFKSKKAGLGTEATRASIIENLISSEYLSVESGKLVPTIKGFTLINELLPKNTGLMKLESTINMERKLDEIEEGKYSYIDYINEIENELDKFIEDIKKSSLNKDDIQNNITNTEIKETKILCPNCGKVHLTMDKYKVFCEECNYKLNVVVAKKKLDEKSIKSLIETGICDTISGFTKSDKSKFNAPLKLDTTENKIVFDFNRSIESELKCPNCGKSLFDKGNHYACDCGLKIWKVISQKKLTKKHLKDLCEKHQTEEIKDFKSKKNIKYAGKLIYNPTKNSIDIEFSKKR